jgi:hypothetical protein
MYKIVPAHYEKFFFTPGRNIDRPILLSKRSSSVGKAACNRLEKKLHHIG